jgi:hypothetical protein
MKVTPLGMSILACLLAAATAEGQNAGAVAAVLPQTTIHRNTTEIPAEKGTGVDWNDLLSTNERGRVRVVLLDQAVVSLGAASELRLLRPAGESQRGTLDLTYGKVRMLLPKLSPGQKAELRTPTAVAGVIGTDFGADASAAGTTRFICLQGEVTISNADPKIGGTVVCRGGDMVDVKAGHPPSEPVPAGAARLDNWRHINEPEYGENNPDPSRH